MQSVILRAMDQTIPPVNHRPCPGQSLRLPSSQNHSRSWTIPQFNLTKPLSAAVSRYHKARLRRCKVNEQPTSRSNIDI